MSAAAQCAIILLGAVAIFVLGGWYGSREERRFALQRERRPLIGEAEVPIRQDPPPPAVAEQQPEPPQERDTEELVMPIGLLELHGLQDDLIALTERVDELEGRMT